MKWFGVVTILVLVIASIALQSVNVKTVETVQILGVKTTDYGKLEREKMYWEKIVVESPTYRDGYVQLAVISYQLGRNEEVRKWVQQAQLVDPNFIWPLEFRLLVQ